MAKEKKEGTEEKVEVHDIDNEFASAEDAPGVTTETKGKEVTTEEKAPETPAKEEVLEKAEADAPVPKTWKDLDLEDFEGKSQEEIARIIVQERRESEHSRKVYGEQGEELGALRKFKTDTEVEKAKPKEEKEPDLLDTMPEMTEGEILDFNAIYEKNPVKAMLKYGGATIKQMIASQLKESLAGKVEGAVGETIAEQKDSIAYSNFLSKHDDVETFLPLMHTLDSEKHLGLQNRPYEELYELAKLGPHTQGVIVNPLYQPIYSLMAEHPTFTFKKALKFTKQGMGAEEKAVEKKAEVKKTIDKIDSVNTASKGTPKSQGTKEIVTIDDEFEI